MAVGISQTKLGSVLNPSGILKEQREELEAEAGGPAQLANCAPTFTALMSKLPVKYEYSGLIESRGAVKRMHWSFTPDIYLWNSEFTRETLWWMYAGAYVPVCALLHEAVKDLALKNRLLGKVVQPQM